LTDEIEIPACAFKPKIIPSTFDRLTTAKRIMTAVQRTGQPFMCEEVTHSRPPKNVQVEYFGQIHSLPIWCTGQDNRERWAPCPCCSLTKPKFFLNMMLVYFPLERLIRIVGHDCFKRFNAAYHSDAWKKFQVEQSNRNTLRILGANIDKVPMLIERLEYNLPAVEAFDIVREELTEVLRSLFRDKLYDIARTGHLPMERKTTRLNVSRTGEETEQEYVVRETYGPVVGSEMIRPGNTSKLAGRLKNVIKGLTIVNVGNGGLNQMSAENRDITLRMFRKSLRSANDIKQKIEEMQRFLDPVNLATINGWGKHENSPMEIYIGLDGNSMHVGREPNNVRRVIVPDGYRRTLLDLPKIVDVAQEESA
jgi:hypothetical protein